MTKLFDTIAAQGDFLIRKIDALPDGVAEVAAENGKHIVAHSETGHHHVIAAQGVRAYRAPAPSLLLFLVVDTPQPITHLRDWDTHEALQMREPGVYEIRPQREYTPKGWQRVAD